jgi:hypothetical protein
MKYDEDGALEGAKVGEEEGGAYGLVDGSGRMTIVQLFQRGKTL